MGFVVSGYGLPVGHGVGPRRLSAFSKQDRGDKAYSNENDEEDWQGKQRRHLEEIQRSEEADQAK